jgi:hypothetical protein
MKCIRPLASRSDNYSSHSSTQHHTNNKPTAMFIIKGIAKLATRPARLGPATTPAPDDSAASSSAPANDQTAEELASSSKVHQPTTNADDLEEAIQQRDILRNIANTSTDPEQVQICKASEQDWQNEITRLEAILAEERSSSTAANESDKQDVDKGRQTSDGKSVSQQSGLEEGETSAEGEGHDVEGSDDGEDDLQQPTAGNGVKATEQSQPSSAEPSSSVGHKKVQAAQQTQPPPAKRSSSVGLKKGQRKRKRAGHGWTKKKSHKEPPPHSENYRFDPRRRYKIRGIMEEKDGRYLVKWAGTDSKGGEFLDSWVPMKEMSMAGYAQKKEFANKRAVTDWQRRKRQGRQTEFNDALGEYDTSGSECVTSDDEDEMKAEEEQVEQRKTKRSKKSCSAKGKGQGKK